MAHKSFADPFAQGEICLESLPSPKRESQHKVQTHPDTSASYSTARIWLFTHSPDLPGHSFSEQICSHSRLWGTLVDAQGNVTLLGRRGAEEHGEGIKSPGFSFFLSPDLPRPSLFPSKL